MKRQDDEMTRYRGRVERKNDRRHNRSGGRRQSDYQPPKFWTWEFIWQFLFVMISGALLLCGCKGRVI